MRMLAGSLRWRGISVRWRETWVLRVLSDSSVTLLHSGAF